MGAELKSNLGELLKKRGWDQKKLVEETGLNPRTISELVNDKTIRINKNALEKIAVALNIDDVSEIIQFKITDN
ncbi:MULTISPECIES: helix-turn-helix transcriptional regulator [unclassified Lysinibacillus]|uniref:helix-turn-helix domain-containing protein n=1 Tax=unclassified Lysinibacillus TaxID=2636778 RepID=UPI00089174C8|nr:MULTISPECIES: helix-turn-helix transcriptional regulator [unclassified Lysinibacillus]SCY98738.1 Cro/C1-type HTH DNA-binding domain-containing protein [Lysinibacillus sp. SG9]SDB47274.1 Cro/C1-type HTH DNA-binding domain-containing protein [Lysinibacillus sp. TC-37]SFT12098.1 Cro/C1-type HTH DNA-binding domain-containing protein [Lysinibacillus sp. SG55]